MGVKKCRFLLAVPSLVDLLLGVSMCAYVRSGSDAALPCMDRLTLSHLHQIVACTEGEDVVNARDELQQNVSPWSAAVLGMYACATLCG